MLIWHCLWVLLLPKASSFSETCHLALAVTAQAAEEPETEILMRKKKTNILKHFLHVYYLLQFISIQGSGAVEWRPWSQLQRQTEKRENKQSSKSENMRGGNKQNPQRVLPQDFRTVKSCTFRAQSIFPRDVLPHYSRDIKLYFL